MGASGVLERGLNLLILAFVFLACGVPQPIAQDDPRIVPMLEAMAKVDRRALGFSPVWRTEQVRVEWAGGREYDVMLHMSGRTARTVAFRRVKTGYEWVGEQEIFSGPGRYVTIDGEVNEEIVITYDLVRISGVPLNRVVISYQGEVKDLSSRSDLSLEIVRPWLKKWGYD